MSDDSAFQGPPAYVAKTSNKKRLVIIFFVVLILVIAGLGGLYVLGNSTKKTPNPTAPVPTEAPVATATPEASTSGSLSPTLAATSSAGLDRKILKVAVLNGSGTAGAAQKIAGPLKIAGYTSLTTGNADVFTYTGITIHVKKAQSGYLKQLQKDIATADSTAKVTASIDDTISTEAEVIVGK